MNSSGAHADQMYPIDVLLGFNLANWRKGKEGNVLFNDALNTFYLRLYGVGHMVKDHSDSERGNPLPLHGLLFSINSKCSFICTITQTGYHIPGSCLDIWYPLAHLPNAQEPSYHHDRFLEHHDAATTKTVDLLHAVWSIKLVSTFYKHACVHHHVTGEIETHLRKYA